MAYTTNLADAARRHLEAAECLHDCDPPCRRRDVAGYLYGLAAECALKQIMRLSTNWRQPDRDDAAFWLHFPELKSRLSETAQGRHATVLRGFADDGAFMNEWDIKMRYAPKSDVPDRLVQTWRAHAKKVISAMEGC
jgi:hypothetical protein